MYKSGASPLRALGDTARNVASPIAQMFLARDQQQQQKDQEKRQQDFQKEMEDLRTKNQKDVAQFQYDLHLDLADYENNQTSLRDASTRAINAATNLVANAQTGLESLAKMGITDPMDPKVMQYQAQLDAANGVLTAPNPQQALELSKGLFGKLGESAQVAGQVAAEEEKYNVNKTAWANYLDRIGNPALDNEARDSAMASLLADKTVPDYVRELASNYRNLTDPEARENASLALEQARLVNRTGQAQLTGIQLGNERLRLLTPVEVANAEQVGIGLGLDNASKGVTLGYLDQQLGLGIDMMQQQLQQGEKNLQLSDVQIKLGGFQVQGAEVDQLITAMGTGVVPTDLSPKMKQALKSAMGIPAGMYSDQALENALSDVAKKTVQVQEAQADAVIRANQIGEKYDWANADRQQVIGDLQTQIMQYELDSQIYAADRRLITDGQADAWDATKHMSFLQAAINNGDYMVVSSYDAALDNPSSPLAKTLYELGITSLEGSVIEAEKNFQDREKMNRIAVETAEQQRDNLRQAYAQGGIAIAQTQMASGEALGNYYKTQEEFDAFLQTEGGQLWSQQMGATAVNMARNSITKNQFDESQRKAAMNLELLMQNPPPLGTAAADTWMSQLRSNYATAGLDPAVFDSAAPGLVKLLEYSEKMKGTELEKAYADLAATVAQTNYTNALAANTRKSTGLMGQSSAKTLSPSDIKNMQDIVAAPFDGQIEQAQDYIKNNCGSDLTKQPAADCAAQSQFLDTLQAERTNAINQVTQASGFGVGNSVPNPTQNNTASIAAMYQEFAEEIGEPLDAVTAQRMAESDINSGKSPEMVAMELQAKLDQKTAAERQESVDAINANKLTPWQTAQTVARIGVQGLGNVYDSLPLPWQPNNQGGE